MSCGCMRVSHSLVQRNKASTNWPSRERTGRECSHLSLPTQSHKWRKSTHFQSEVLLLHAPVLLWQSLASESNRLSALILFLTLPPPFLHLVSCISNSYLSTCQSLLFPKHGPSLFLPPWSQFHCLFSLMRVLLNGFPYIHYVPSPVCLTHSWWISVSEL